ncbi:hypothetical protein AGLY_014736 [Aphis glycines]|uniref:Uncharacterized protein n=1 Tax=Aphis glycines TaxID=307491 RepID=A0A6G0T223_APHGL|nr:hypothetical protein AGLY_014736 [Aphis glycines]
MYRLKLFLLYFSKPFFPKFLYAYDMNNLIELNISIQIFILPLMSHNFQLSNRLRPTSECVLYIESTMNQLLSSTYMRYDNDSVLRMACGGLNLLHLYGICFSMTILKNEFKIPHNYIKQRFAREGLLRIFLSTTHFLEENMDTHDAMATNCMFQKIKKLIILKMYVHQRIKIIKLFEQTTINSSFKATFYNIKNKNKYLYELQFKVGFRKYKNQTTVLTLYSLCMLTVQAHLFNYLIPRFYKQQSISDAEMRVFRWMSGVVTEDKIRNKYVRDSIGIVSVD